MQYTVTPDNTAYAIWSRIVKPERGSLSPDAARAILELDFDAEDRQRVDLLSAKAAAGRLSPEERVELEEYIRVNNLLMILQSKARLSLKESGRKAHG
jgi:hypothetical protein